MNFNLFPKHAISLLTLSAAAALASGAVHAQATQAAPAASNDPSEQVARSEIGHSTREWLELQRSNRAAAPAQPMSGEEAGLAYARYMKSFNSKIPDLYGSSLTQSGGSGSGTGSANASPSN